MSILDHIKGIWGISLCLWGLYCLYTTLRIQWFIVRRYEHDTNLIDTKFFKEHATFTRHLPNFFASSFYGTHLLMCAWGWRIYGTKKAFEDIKDPKYVTKHFSNDEIRRVKMLVISGLIIVIHGLIYYALLN